MVGDQLSVGWVNYTQLFSTCIQDTYHISRRFPLICASLPSLPHDRNESYLGKVIPGFKNETFGMELSAA